MSKSIEKIAYSDGVVSGKSSPIAILLASFFGFLGLHRFYCGYFGIGLFQALTCGGFVIWFIVDIISLFTNKFEDSKGNPLANYNTNIATSLVFFAAIMAIVWGNLYVGWVQKAISKAQIAQISTPLDNVKKANENSLTQKLEIVDKEAQQKSLDRQAFRNRDFKYKTTTGVNILEDEICTDYNNHKAICGTVVNINNANAKNIVIKYSLLDKDGKFISFTEAKIYTLKGMSEWKYQAPIFYNSVEKYKIFKVSVN